MSGYEVDPAAVFAAAHQLDVVRDDLRQQLSRLASRADALLGKQYGVQPAGWRAAAGNYGDQDSFRSVADVVDASSLTKVRSFKQEQKAKAKGRS